MVTRNREPTVASPTAIYEEGRAFLRGQGMVNNVLARLAADLDRHGIAYAVIGAVALNQHGYRRFTEDIGVLMTGDGLRRFRDELVGRGYVAAFSGATKMFKTAQEGVRVEVVTTGEYPGDGKPKPIAFPDPDTCSEEIDGVRTVTLPKLIELKLASGMTATDRLKDLADVQETIKVKGLGAAFADSLDASVREKFHELLRGVEAAKAREGD